MNCKETISGCMQRDIYSVIKFATVDLNPQ